ncbi:NAD(+)/NADH kinase [Halarcobacter bivalviorum]|uniref:NAD kinase n=1 Tax=Halarcobacter bivalviorum TaxID=663364 RepID=A0AAX2A5M1_9BACT|nr:NAD(+)/NADH kinase [Halarcobacter bivalviorum]AXH11451.1 inorganic polyphosphate/ATP-NAD kinase [Halarcobacter bivalviorum]RXK09363.1 NAD(+) kinase [Halarcobacter bivalviorum]
MKLTRSAKKLEKKSKAGIILKPDSPEIEKEYYEIVDYFKAHNIETFVEERSSKMLNISGGLKLEELCKKVDFLVSVGGDGTLLSVVRNSFEFNIPILGIHLGTLGFLTDIVYEELPKFLIDFMNNNYRIDNRMLVECQVNNKSFVAFNDIVISRKTVSSMIKIKAKINGSSFNNYYGDGVIISTPTGSTAYNLSVGGPVVYPLTEAFIITPVAPHSLTQRPLVMPADIEIEFKIKDEQGAILLIDGQDTYEVDNEAVIKVTIAKQKAKLIHRTKRNFFEVLNDKLQWGN